MIRLRFWEYVFFAGLTGSVALYPFVRGQIAPAFAATPYATLLVLTVIFSFAALAYGRHAHARQTRRSAMAATGLGGAAIVMIGLSSASASPALAAWFIDTGIALFSFGYMLANRLLWRAESDLVRNIGHAIVVSLSANALLILIGALAGMLPVPLIAFATVAFFLAATPYEAV